MKLFPVALAALALASCSDDIALNNAQKINENALYFTMENTDATRAGVFGDATDAYSTLQFRWTKDDQIRVYDENLAMYDVYEYGGESFAQETPATAFTNPAPWDEKKLSDYSIGLYPNSAVEAVYLDKTDRGQKHIEMMLPVEYTYETADLEKEAYRCDVPMYGNINSVATGVTEMNFLTAWTRIYMRNIPTDVTHIAIVSENPLQPLAGMFEAYVHYPLKPGDQPYLAPKAGTDETWSNMLYTALPTIAEVADEGGICFPLPVQEYDNLTIYGLKENSGTDPETVGDVKADWDALVTAGEAIQIATRDDVPFTRRRQCWSVLYTYTYYLGTDELNPFRPGEVSKVLAANADKIIGDFRIVPYSEADGLDPVDPTQARTLTSGPGDYYTHRIEIPEISDKANMILDFGGAGIKYDEALQIYDKNPETKQFSGKLTIIPGEIKGGTAKIEINLPLATVYIIGDEANDPLGNIDIQNAKEVHIGDGTTPTKQESGRTTKVQGGKLFIENNAKVNKVYATAYPGSEDQHAQEVIVKGGYVDFLYDQTEANITLLGNGYDATAEEQYVGEARVTSIECDKITGPVTIESKGQAWVKNFKAPADKSQLTIKSTLLPRGKEGVDADRFDVASANMTTALYGGMTGNGIFTAAQLAKGADDGIASDVMLLTDVMDLNNLTWTGGELDGNFQGFNFTSLDPTDAKTMTSTQKNVIKNLKLAKPAATGNGLFATLTTGKAIAGLELNTVKMEEDQTAPLDAPLGALVGDALGSAAFSKIDVQALTFKSQDGNVMGGILGRANGVLVMNESKVAGTITCRGFGGGLVGQITAGSAGFQDCEAAVTFAHSMKGMTLHTAYAGTFGAMVGGVKATAALGITVRDSKYGTAISKALKGNGNSNSKLCFGAEMTPDDIPYFGGNPWVGRFTNVLGTLTTYNSLSVADKGKKFYKNVYAEESMQRFRYESGAGTYTEAGQKNILGHALGTVGEPNTMIYDGGTTLGHDANQYGFNIYSGYGAIAYDNVYVDAAPAE